MQGLVWLAALGVALLVWAAGPVAAQEIKLPLALQKGALSVEEALAGRRTWRSFRADSLSIKQLSQLLWAAYGVTAQKWGLALKTAPSAGALYPLDIYAVVGRVEGLPAGVYRFVPAGHSLLPVSSGDRRRPAARAAMSQMWAAQAPVTLIIAAEYARCTQKYGPRGRRYTHIESGCAAQNIFLQAQALGLRAGIIGAFQDRALAEALGLPPEHEPLLMMPVGHGR